MRICMEFAQYLSYLCGWQRNSQAIGNTSAVLKARGPGDRKSVV